MELEGLTEYAMVKLGDVVRMLEWEKEWIRVYCDGLGMLKEWVRRDWREECMNPMSGERDVEDDREHVGWMKWKEYCEEEALTSKKRENACKIGVYGAVYVGGIDVLLVGSRCSIMKRLTLWKRTTLGARPRATAEE